MNFRAARAGDVPVLRTMVQALSAEDGGQHNVASEAALLTHGFGPRPLFQAVIAETDTPLGMAIYFADFSTHRGEPGVYVQDIFVIPAARGAGLGPRLLAAVMAHQEFGARYMTLAVNPSNTGATDFYRGLGFRPRGYDFLILDGANLAALA